MLFCTSIYKGYKVKSPTLVKASDGCRVAWGGGGVLGCSFIKIVRKLRDKETMCHKVGTWWNFVILTQFKLKMFQFICYIGPTVTLYTVTIFKFGPMSVY